MAKYSANIAKSVAAKIDLVRYNIERSLEICFLLLKETTRSTRLRCCFKDSVCEDKDISFSKNKLKGIFSNTSIC